MRVATMMRKPSAFLPVAMSAAAVITLLAALAGFGLAALPQADEGAAAHIWQLLMGGQLPIIAFFAIRWLPQAPRQAMAVLGLQLVAGLTAAAPVFLLHL